MVCIVKPRRQKVDHWIIECPIFALLIDILYQLFIIIINKQIEHFLTSFDLHLLLAHGDSHQILGSILIQLI
jgi:hypothetical protein